MKRNDKLIGVGIALILASLVAYVVVIRRGNGGGGGDGISHTEACKKCTAKSGKHVCLVVG